MQEESKISVQYNDKQDNLREKLKVTLRVMP